MIAALQSALASFNTPCCLSAGMKYCPCGVAKKIVYIANQYTKTIFLRVIIILQTKIVEIRRCSGTGKFSRFTM